MPRSLRADRRELRLKGLDEGNPTVDIFFDGHRVWSTRLPDPHPRSTLRRVPWPEAMRGYLAGGAAVAVRSSATGEDVAAAEVAFGGNGRVAITDAQGRWLAMNKWNRLGPSFDGGSSGLQERLLAAAALLAQRVEDWGYPIYMVGGNLLGAMRSGSLLPHDDDIDFAFWCDRSDPQDVALVTFELERQLERAGYTTVRHSHAHLEVVFFDDAGSTDYYIDIFAGYHGDDGVYNQPFALRGELARDELLPTTMVEVDGVPLPAPADPEAWLALAYGPDWRVPDPSFRWEPEPATLRRFANCYGVFNRQRVYWEKTWQGVDRRDDHGSRTADGDPGERQLLHLRDRERHTEDPVADDLVADDPVADDPVADDHATDDPGSDDPGTDLSTLDPRTGPGTFDPGTFDPGTFDPGTLDPGTDDHVDVDRFLRLLPPSALVVDLGCGDGRQSERIAAAGHRVLGVDYSFEALRVARQTRPDGVEYRFLNLNDRHGLLRFAFGAIGEGQQPYFFARNLLHQMPPLGRADLLVTLRGVLDRQTFLYATFDTTPVNRVAANPETWRLPTATLRREAWRWKLGMTQLAARRRPTPYGVRRNVTAVVWT